MRQGALVITPNQRLSQQLIQDYFYQQQEPLIQKPRCFAYQTFLQELYQHALQSYPFEAHPRVLNSHQQRHLFAQILQTLLPAEHQQSLVTEVMTAWKRCQQWCLSLQHPLFATIPQQQQFQAWIEAFQQALDAKQAITPEHIIPYLLALHKRKNSTEWYPVHAMIWACFDDEFPLLQQLQQTLAGNGYLQYHYDLAAGSAVRYRCAPSDQEQEWLNIAQWLKAKLASGQRNIAVVVPDLQQQFRSLRRFFLTHFQPDEINISLGLPLSEYPLVSHAMHFLALSTDLSVAQARLLLHSPFMTGSKQEWSNRIEIEQSSLLQEPRTTIPLFCEILNTTSPLLATALLAMPAYPKQATIATWTTLFRARLEILGFPGEYSLDSDNYQCFQRFLTLLDDFYHISLVCQDKITATDAMQILREIAQHTIFQPEKANTPIKILGLLEASGCHFDGIWICGMTDQNFPQRAHMSAFIPITLQKSLDMPHANTERELHFAQKLLTRMHNSCAECIMSYPEFQEALHQSSSPLITEYPCITPATLNASEHMPALQAYVEPYVYPLPSSASSLAGGANILAYQAQCPFRAFAQYRLHAKKPQPISRGLDASERGQILHRTLELLWQQLQTQQMLLSLSSAQLDSMIATAIDQAMLPWISKRPFSLPKLVQGLEAKRLYLLVKASLDWDSARPPFTVAALEKSGHITLAELQFQVRIDRLDCSIDQQEQWIIDYKTNIPSSLPWYDERPTTPQLLLYTLLDDAIRVVLFLELKQGRLTCVGLSESPKPLKGIQTLKADQSWLNLRHKWQNTLHGLANEIKDGQCQPLPAKAAICSRCDFQTLCRYSA